MIPGFSKSQRELNLIPEEQQKLKSRKIKIVVIVISAVVISLQIGVFVVAQGLVLSEQNTQNNLEEELVLKNREWEKVASPAASVQTIKSKLATYQKFSSEHPEPKIFIDKIRSFIPQGIVLLDISVNKTGDSVMSGTALEPDVIYQFLNVLNAEKTTFSKPVLNSVNKNDSGGYNFIVEVIVK